MSNTNYSSTLISSQRKNLDVFKHCLLLFAAFFISNLLLGQATVFSQAPILGSASNFGAFSGASAGITNQGNNTMIHGSIGTNGASTTLTGFTDAVTNISYTQAGYTGTVYGGVYAAVNPITTEVLSDIQSAYNQISPSALLGGYDAGLELGGQTLSKGVYVSASSYSITGANLILDAANDPNAVWIFQAGSSLTVGTATVAQSVILLNGAQAKNVFWYVGSGTVINYGGGGSMVGTIISHDGSTISSPGVAAVTILNGRIFSLAASVTMVNTIITTDNIWTGAVSIDWFTTGNWSTGTIPVSSDAVLIPSVPNNPTISSGIANLFNLTVYNGATVTVNSSLQFGGSIIDTNYASYNISKTGTLNAIAGSIVMNGYSAQTIPAYTFVSNTLQNLTLNNSAGVTLGGALKIIGILTPASGIVTTGGYLTIAPGAAIISDYNNISGKVIIQQNIIGQRGWRALANPFTTATNIPAVAENNGIAINTVTNSNGSTDSQIWNAVQGKWNYVNGSSWAANTMYGLFIRGLANQVTGISYISGPSPFTYSISGTVNGNSISITPNDPSQFTMVGNPYAAPVTSQALTGQTPCYYYTYKITEGATAAARQTMQGSWVFASTQSNTTNTIPVLGVVAYQSSNTTPYTVSTTDINNGGTVLTDLFGGNPPASQLALQVEQNGYFLDKVLLQLDSTITVANFNNKTLQKFYNNINNLYSITPNGTDMAIDTRSLLGEVPLGMYALPGNYSFRVNTNSMPLGTTVYLKDSITHMQTALLQNMVYNFTITADTSTYGEHRFSLVFNSKQTATVSSDSSNIIWTGAKSTAWNDSGNWYGAVVPSLNSNVIIPFGPSNYPILNSSVSVATVTIAANEYLTVSGTNTLTATGGITVHANGGIIAAGNINANVTLQQSISPGTGWRFMNNPFANNLNLQNVALNNNATFIASNNVIWSNQQNKWVYSNTIIPTNTPYALFINGSTNGFTLSETGTLNGANIIYTPYISGKDTSWMFAGNPYPTAVNSSALTGQTLGIPYYQWDVVSQTWIVNLASDQNIVIPVLSAIAYWPWNNSSYTVTTADMHHFNNGGNWNSGVFGLQPSIEYIELEADKDTLYQDKLFLRTDMDAMPNGTAIHDLRKMVNAGFNLYSIGTDGKQLAVNTQQAWSDTVSIGMIGAAGSYRLKVNNDNLLNNSADSYLLDGLTNTKTLLAAGMTYSFEMGKDSILNRNRFKIVFSSFKQSTSVDSSNTSGNLRLRVLGNVNTSGIYQVEISNANAGQIRMIVHDPEGNVIGSITGVNGMNVIQTGNKPAGMYLLEVSDGKSRVLTKLIKL